jgi:hypothetical protein
VGTIGKEHFTYLYSSARQRALTPRNIKAGFKASGLFPFNPDRVLTHIPKPPTTLTIPKTTEAKGGACPQDKILYPAMTPVTPVTVEALSSLHR